jgi:hypothetical protein
MTPQRGSPTEQVVVHRRTRSDDRSNIFPVCFMRCVKRFSQLRFWVVLIIFPERHDAVVKASSTRGWLVSLAAWRFSPESLRTANFSGHDAVSWVVVCANDPKAHRCWSCEQSRKLPFSFPDLVSSKTVARWWAKCWKARKNSKEFLIPVTACVQFWVLGCMLESRIFGFRQLVVAAANLIFIGGGKPFRWWNSLSVLPSVRFLFVGDTGPDAVPTEKNIKRTWTQSRAMTAWVLQRKPKIHDRSSKLQKSHCNWRAICA